MTEDEEWERAVAADEKWKRELAESRRWYDVFGAIGVGILLIVVHTYGWLDEKLRKEGV